MGVLNKLASVLTSFSGTAALVGCSDEKYEISTAEITTDTIQDSVFRQKGQTSYLKNFCRGCIGSGDYWWCIIPQIAKCEILTLILLKLRNNKFIRADMICAKRFNHCLKSGILIGCWECPWQSGRLILFSIHFLWPSLKNNTPVMAYWIFSFLLVNFQT